MNSNNKYNSVIGMKTIVKFFKNPHKKRAEKHPVITRTLKKIGFVTDNLDPDTPMPKDGEFWIVEIERVAKSTFILKPLKKVEDPSKILRLIPGFYTVNVVNNIIVVKPRREGLWLLPKALKNAFGYVDGVIVVYEEPPSITQDKEVETLINKTETQQNPYIVQVQKERD